MCCRRAGFDDPPKVKRRKVEGIWAPNHRERNDVISVACNSNRRDPMGEHMFPATITERLIKLKLVEPKRCEHATAHLGASLILKVALSRSYCGDFGTVVLTLLKP